MRTIALNLPTRRAAGRFLIYVCLCLLGSVLISACSKNPLGAIQPDSTADSSVPSFEGPPISPVITAGPFDLHRKYGSMQGPYVGFDIKIADLVHSKEIVLDESMVSFLEKDATMARPDVMQLVNGSYGKAKGIEKGNDKELKLYWLKGVRITVTDENDRPLPESDFFCHFNLDVDPDFRNRAFPYAEKCHDVRLITITQGQMEMMFPKGFAVPAASDEVWHVTFQAINRVANLHKRVKHHCTFYFLDDNKLRQPITALAAYAPFITVQQDAKAPMCGGDSDCTSCQQPVKIGSMSLVPLKKGETGHWSVPPGLHVYQQSASTYVPEFGKKEVCIHAAWAHVHPFCQKFSLVEKSKAGERNVFTINSQTRTQPQLTIVHTDCLSLERGINIGGSGNGYDLKVQYNNTTDASADAMAAMAIFYADTAFRKFK
jgi:hypothetical protein